MAIRIVCPQCQSEYTVADELRGKKARCRQCETSFVIEPAPEEPATPEILPDEPPARPTRARRDEEPERRRRPRKARKRASAVVPLLIVGGTVVTVLAAVGAGLGVYYYWKSQQPAPAVARPAEKPADAPAGTAPAAPARGMRSFWAAAMPPFENKPVGHADEPEVGDAPEEAPTGDERPAAPTKPPETPAGSTLAPDVLQKVKRATFYLRVASGDGRQGEGSGFLVDPSGIVVTNAHVIGMHFGAQKPKQVEVFVNSGERGEKKLSGEVLGVDRRNDLALLRVPADGLPAPLAVKSATDLYETQPLWVSGFPLGERLGKNVTVTACPVSSLRKDGGVLTRLQVHGDMLPGNSGGPVVDARGDVVGVAVAIIVQTKINFAVPGDAVLHLLRGRLAHVNLGVPYEEGGRLKVPVTVHVHDLLRRVRKVSVDFWVGEPGRDRPAGAAAPAARPADEARTQVALAYEPKTGLGQGTLTLPGLPAGKVYWVQPVYEDAGGTTQWADGRTYRAPPPAERKPARLELRPDGQERPLRLQRNTTLRLDNTVNGVYEVGVQMQTRWTEGLHPGGGAAGELRRKYTGLSLGVRYNKGKPQDSPLPPLLAPHLSALSSTLRLDGELRPVRTDFGAAVPAEGETRWHLSELDTLTQRTLEPWTVPLPGKEVQPGETWKPQTARTLLVETFGIGYASPSTVDVTCTYAGTCRRDGRDEAVVALEGVLNAAGEDEPDGQRRATGLAYVDLATGRTTRLEVSYDLDFVTVVRDRPLSGRSGTVLRLEEEAPAKDH